MGLVARCLAGPHLGIGESNFQRIEAGDDISQFCRRHAMGQAHQLFARHVHVHQHARHLAGIHRHGFRCHLGIKMVAGDEFIDHVEVMDQHAVHAGNFARLYGDAGFRIGGAGEGRKPMGRVFHRKLVQPQGPLVPLRVTPPPIWSFCQTPGPSTCKGRRVRDERVPSQDTNQFDICLGPEYGQFEVCG